MRLMGFLGFWGFWTYHTDGRVAPFVFFMFFGLFGFFYEGKMSNTFMDERYKENKCRAQLKAHKITLTIIYAALFLLLGMEGRILRTMDAKLITLVIVISFSMAADVFLGEYLLYRYDHGEQIDESGE